MNFPEIALRFLEKITADLNILRGIVKSAEYSRILHMMLHILHVSSRDNSESSTIYLTSI